MIIFPNTQLKSISSPTETNIIDRLFPILQNSLGISVAERVASWFIDQILIWLSRTRPPTLLLFPILKPFFGRPFKKKISTQTPGRQIARKEGGVGQQRDTTPREGEGGEEWEITRGDICRWHMHRPSGVATLFGPSHASHAISQSDLGIQTKAISFCSITFSYT